MFVMEVSCLVVHIDPMILASGQHIAMFITIMVLAYVVWLVN